MKYVTYRAVDGGRVGLLEGGEVYDVGFDGDMVEFITAGAPSGKRSRIGDVILEAPLRPVSLRDFLAFEGHLINAFGRLGREIPDEWYEIPAYYKGLPSTVIGPDADIPWPSYTDELDHELELAVVIGKAGRNISRGDALDHVFGVTIWNDLSARDTQRRELPIGMGPCKSKDWDGSNVLGPCIVTMDEIDLLDVQLEVRVNGECWGRDTTRSMHHSFADMIAYSSRDQMLYPGEVIGSGTTAGGSGLELGRSLQPGDIIELEALGVGVLRNVVGSPSLAG